MRPGTWMTSCPKAMGWRFWNLKKRVSWDSTLEEGSWFSGARRGQTSSFQRGAARSRVRWKSQHSKKLCLSLLMSKNLKLKKVNKSFVPETNFVFFGFSMSISHIRILVVFLDIYYMSSKPSRVNLSFIGCPHSYGLLLHLSNKKKTQRMTYSLNSIHIQVGFH